MQSVGVDLCRELLATKAAAGLARTYVRQRLVLLGFAGAVDDAVLIAGELVANAVAATPRDATLRIFLGHRPRGLVFGVWDGSAAMPVPRSPGEITLETIDRLPDEPGGWGLGLVAALARDYWTEPAPQGGKWVCALLDV